MDRKRGNRTKNSAVLLWSSVQDILKSICLSVAERKKIYLVFFATVNNILIIISPS